MRPVIFIPTFNNENCIQNTLLSIHNQVGIEKVPVYIIDNSSEDNTIEKALKFKNVFIQKLPRVGRIQNWNRCLDIFETKFKGRFDCMKFVFAGDTLKDNCMKTQIELMSYYKMVTAAHDVFKLDGGVYTMRHFDVTTFFDSVEMVQESILRGNFMAGCTSNVLFHRDILKGARFDETMEWASDWMFWIDLALKRGVLYVSEPLVEFRMKYRKTYLKLAMSNKAEAEENFVKVFLQKLREKLTDKSYI